MTPRENKSLEQALTLMLGKLLYNLTHRAHMHIIFRICVKACIPLLVCEGICRLQSVRSCLIRTKDTELSEVILHYISCIGSKNTRCFRCTETMASFLDRQLIVFNIRKFELLAPQATIGVRVSAESQIPLRHELGNLRAKRPVLIPKLRRLVGTKPAA